MVRVRFLDSASYIWVEFVAGFCPCSERFFSGYSGLPLSSKTNISKFQFVLGTVDEEPPCGCATVNSHLFIYLFIYYLIDDGQGLITAHIEL